LTDGRLDRTSLLRENARVAPENRDDSCAQGDGGNILTNDSEGCERVKPEEVGNPEAGCSDVTGLACRKYDVGKIAPVHGHVEDAKFHEILQVAIAA
jgi:hypothetical protein